MLTQIANIICSTLNTIVGFFVIKKLLGSEVKLNNLKNIGLLSILIVIPIMLYDVKYKISFTLIIYIMSIVIYKYIFNKSFVNSTVLVSVMFVLMAVADVITSVAFISFVDINEVRGCWYLKLIINIIVFIITLYLSNIKKIKSKLKMFLLKVENNRKLMTNLFFILSILLIACLLYEFAIVYHGLNNNYLINLIIMVALFILCFIYVNDKNNYYTLMTDYNGLFDFVQEFETQVEKEQFKIHEYNNQLAMIMSLSKESAVINQIQSMIKSGINIEGEWIRGLKSIPKSGLKGLILYKLSRAKEQNVNTTIDISSKTTDYMNGLDENELKVLCDLVGLYFDNAIDEAKKTSEKNVTLEIYVSKNILNIIVTNSVAGKVDIKNINKKGVSTKGKGRGKGLYFASKIIEKNNDWLLNEQKVIDDKYYVQKISIKKENTSS